jgi:hypothetical protein
MDIIEKALEVKGLTFEELPKKLQNKINFLDELQETMKTTEEELKAETDEEVREEMREAILKSQKLSDKLVSEITSEVNAHEQSDDDTQAPPVVRRPMGNRPVYRASVEEDDEIKPKKKGAALGWIIGGVVLVLTLGAVNTMSNNK